MSGKNRMLKRKLGSSCLASMCATALSMQFDWPARNCAKIGTDTLYMEIVIGFPSLVLLANYAREISGLPIQLKRPEVRRASWPGGCGLLRQIGPYLLTTTRH